MRTPSPTVHLSYCTNIHPGESWAEVRANLERYLVPVRERVAPGRPFGVGLRLSAESARALAVPEALQELRGFLSAHDLYVFTINGFPYGPFHGRPVKEQVYLPDWLDPERLAYTDLLADILAELLPDGVEGTISTVPGAFAPRVHGEADQARMAEALLDHVAHLVRLRATTGRRVALALEPEPCCFLETMAEAVAFFARYLFSAAAVARVSDSTGLTREAAATAIREHLGVCLDACHMAVEFEDSAQVLDALRSAGIRVPKVQVTAGLSVVVREGDDATLDALGRVRRRRVPPSGRRAPRGRHAVAPSRSPPGTFRRARGQGTGEPASGGCTSTFRCSAPATAHSRGRRDTSPSCCGSCASAP
jgi:sugar phosphate isomerase/epimerase